LEKIYKRFHHIGNVIDIFREYLIERGASTFPKLYEREKVTEFFTQAKQQVEGILCEIQTIFVEIKTFEEYEDIKENIHNRPRPNDQISEEPKIDLWVIYREYETLVDYSYQLLSALLEEQN
jgi:hypothetical protein